MSRVVPATTVTGRSVVVRSGSVARVGQARTALGLRLQSTADEARAQGRGRRGIMPSEMTEPCCPYLVCEKTAFRASLDLSAAAPMNIVVTWYCRHPFHGMRLELGDARSEVERHCAACSLPRQQVDGGAD